MTKVSIISLITVFSLFSGIYAQVDVSINSNDPAFPFPQFLPYQNSSGTLGNVGTKPGAGVTHAEMEQTIRDAYQIMMNRAEKPGGGVGGIDYIKYRSNPQCSEGDGYGLLGAAAMADKKTFDGLWLYIHDFTMNKVKKYSDCSETSPGYAYSRLPGWTGSGANSATDGDVDIGLALLTAYYQWGEFMGIDDACGNPISYKYEVIEFLKGMTDTLVYSANGSTLVSGDIGLDGYFKGGDSWQELTDWGSNTANTGFTRPTESKGPQTQYFDYTAPSYFKEFADFLSAEDSAKYAWNIYQFRRAETSSDWLMGEMYNADPRNLPISGSVSLTGTTPTFKFTGNMGEDFRLAWRTVLNRMWHGNPTYGWNPTTHQVELDKPNVNLQNVANRFARFLWDSRQSPWNNSCAQGANKDFTYWGPMTILTDLSMVGVGGGFYYLNWMPAVGSFSAVVSQDYSLMAELYRQLDIEWDVETPGDGYLSSVPVYYHGWYRLLGLLAISGNYHAPANLKPAANTKVYLNINKTFAFNNDTITYTIDYRNFGSIDAQDVVITDTLHKDFEYISSTGNGSYNNASHVVSWNIGKIAGFKTATGVSPTKGQFELTIKIKNPTQQQYRNKVTITSSNSPAWTSSEYPNTISSVMERNYIDIAKRALVITKKASVTRVKPGSTVDYTIDFKNTSEAGWINGGRPGVRFSFSQKAEERSIGVLFKLFHDAEEAYIDYGNYRVSYFLYDSLLNKISKGATPGWSIRMDIVEGIDANFIQKFHEPIVPGSDSLGKWNQRLVVQFSDPLDKDRIINLATIERHLSQYRGMRGRIHKGGTSPLRLKWDISNYDSHLFDINWNDDWSYDPNITDKDDGNYFPITNDWTNPEKPNVPVNGWNPKACATSDVTVNNILVEEWDGYTWRRVAGNGPMPGREANNVVIRDTIPEGFSFVAFTGESPLGIDPHIDGNVISWNIPRLQIQQGGTISYTALAKGSCPNTPDRVTVGRAWISADKESPVADSAIVTISCDTVVRPPTPDHLDIITDTSAIDKYADEPFVRIKLEAGTADAIVYVVVRDKSGLLIDYPLKTQWISLDTTIAKVAGDATQPYKATINKNDQGSTIIIVSDPDNPAIKPDSCTVTAIATPPWPAIANAKMGDDNGDIIPDVMYITLNNMFQVNQKLDSVIIYYRGDSRSIPASSVVQQDKQLTVSIDNLTTVDSKPAGQVTLVMTVEGTERRVTKSFTDGVGPAITGARLGQSISGNTDTLSLAFSEHVNTLLLTGPMLQLIKKGTKDTVLLAIQSITPAGFYTEAKVTVSGENNFRPEEGDYLRFVPGENGQKCVDNAGNLPHRLNIPAVIKANSPPITRAWYTDKDGDGIVKDITIQFARVVTIDDIIINLNWGAQRTGSLDSSVISYQNNDSTLIHLSLPDEFTSAVNVATSGLIFLNVEFQTFAESRSGIATDSAAPVITSATIYPAILTSKTDETADTLKVTFSENINILNSDEEFKFEKSRLISYSMDLTLKSTHQNVATFFITRYHDDVYPQNGDSIWINYGAIGDTLYNIQNIQNNRKVPLEVKPIDIQFFVTVGPNPFEVNGVDLCKIKVSPRGHTSTNLDVDASVTIIDGLGNSVLRLTPMKYDELTRESTYEWNGTNQRGRLVGNGTYMVNVKIKSQNSEIIEKAKIGVRRKR